MSDIISILGIIPGIIIAISLHEYAHAKTAIKLGDPTPKLQGRDNINPINHIDPIGFICLLIAHFGWGKPVQIDIRNFKNPLKDQMLVSIAGPAMNLLIAFITLIILNLLDIFGAFGALSKNVSQVLQIIITYTVLINISLCIFNLLPLPNFDGSKILLYFLPNKLKIEFLKLYKYTPIIFLIIVLTPVPRYIITPVLNWVLTGMQYIINIVMGIFI